MESRVIPKMHEYHVSEISGFLLEFPLTDLPEYFRPWMEIGKSISYLLKTHKLRDEVDEMPLLDARRLQGHKQLRLANLLLSLMTSGYIWQDGDKKISKKIPEQLAIPVCYVAEMLDLPVIVTHNCICAANWTLIDKNGPVELCNMDTITTLPGGSQSSWFFLVTAQVELSAVPGLKAISKAQEGVLEQNMEKVQDALDAITAALVDMKAVLPRMFDNLDVETFYNVIRPYLAGWGGANSPAPEGILFEGVSDRPKKAIGGSAAQSPPLQCFDAVLNIQHPQERQHFLDLMRQYMLPSHRAYIEAVRAGPSVREFVKKQDCKSLTSAYNKSVSALISLRTYHVQLTTRYVVIPASRQRTEQFKYVSKKGTGGTEIIPFLKSIRDSTKQFQIPANLALQ